MEDKLTMELKQAEQEILELKSARMVASTLTSYTASLANVTPAKRYRVNYRTGSEPIFTEFYLSNGGVVMQSTISNNQQYVFVLSNVLGTLTASSTRPIASIVEDGDF